MESLGTDWLCLLFLAGVLMTIGTEDFRSPICTLMKQTIGAIFKDSHVKLIPKNRQTDQQFQVYVQHWLPL